MAYKIVLLSTAEKDMHALPQKPRSRVIAALLDLEQFPHDSGIKKLKVPIEGYRKRVGEYRILFDVSDHTILVHRIKHRKDAYRD